MKRKVIGELGLSDYVQWYCHWSYFCFTACKDEDKEENPSFRSY